MKLRPEALDCQRMDIFAPNNSRAHLQESDQVASSMLASTGDYLTPEYMWGEFVYSKDWQSRPLADDISKRRLH